MLVLVVPVVLVLTLFQPIGGVRATPLSNAAAGGAARQRASASCTSSGEAGRCTHIIGVRAV